LDEMKNEVANTAPKTPSERPRPTRRRKTKMEIFKETTLPLIIIGVAALFILTFIIGSIVRGTQKRKIEEAASIAASESVAAEEAQLSAEVNDILVNAEALAAGYDYDGAIALIDGFSGNIGAYPELQDARVRYEFNKGSLVVLNKLAGEQVDVFVNGQCIAKGDVVVVEDNFGVRITEIIQEEIEVEEP